MLRGVCCTGHPVLFCMPLRAYAAGDASCGQVCFPYGMMVTASHNPSLYNGIKVFTAGGRDADEVQNGEIEAYIAQVDGKNIKTMEYAAAVKAGQVTEFYPTNEYIDDVMVKIDMEAIKRAQLRIVLDPMYGVGTTALNTILTTGRCDVKVIHEEHDTLFGHRMPAPSADRLGLLTHCVVDGWVIARFSGMEPLLRVFGEMPEKEQAQQVCNCFKEMIDRLDMDAAG